MLRGQLAVSPNRPIDCAVVLAPLVETWDDDVPAVSTDPLGFPRYADQLARAGGRESVVTGRTAAYALVEGCFDVLGGSMGAVHGERVVRAFDRAASLRLPVVVVSTSGGARMQEGMVSLIQMARTASASRRHAAAGLLQLGVYRAPTTGGVFASYASLVDARCASPGATVGFAGPRVVEQTLGAPLPDGSHTAESAFAAGLVDAALGLRDAPLPPPPRLGDRPGHGRPITQSRDVRASAWDEVLAARAPSRPTGIDWAARLCASWTELHSTDPTVRAGLATFEGQRVVVVASDRYAADGRPTPAGFRLAQRAFGLAARLALPVVTFVDTPGAHPGAQSEADGVAGEIARTFGAMATLPVPSVSVCVGEGGSGGALAMAYADRLLIQEHAIFSVIAPEGAAAILERDAGKAPVLADRLKLTSSDLLQLGIVDAIAPEDDLRAAVVDALATARVGERERRFDEATMRALRS
jgi:acetyl-CoA carboxylase carboxyl transferase subunit beta